MNSFAASMFILPLLLVQSALAQRTLMIPLETAVHGLLKMNATVNGHVGTFLFDSGSGFSNISPSFAAAIGCQPWGQITGFRMTGERLDMQHCDNVSVQIGGRSFASTTVGVFDLSGYLPSEVGHIDGTIALDLFANDVFTLSYGGRFIQILDLKALALQTAGVDGMPIHVVRDAEGLALTVNLPVNTSAGTAWFEMDSGNTSSRVLVSRSLAPLFQLTSDTKVASLIRIIFADGSAFVGQPRILQLILDGNLGASFLSSYDVTIDLPHKTAWLTGRSPGASGRGK